MGHRERAPSSLAGAVVVIAIISALFTPACAENRVALVIGNSLYQHAPQLANPENDADLIATALSRAGFAVEELKNLDDRAMRNAAFEFAHKSESADDAVIYYTGHGIRFDGVNYLVPVEASFADPAKFPLEAVPANLLLQAVARAHRLRLLILDACRDNPFKAELAASGAHRVGTLGLEAPSQIEVAAIAFSAKTGTVALDGSGPNSPYAEALARRIDEKDIAIRLMFQEVASDVIKATTGQQIPFADTTFSGSESLVPNPVTSNSGNKWQGARLVDLLSPGTQYEGATRGLAENAPPSSAAPFANSVNTGAPRFNAPFLPWPPLAPSLRKEISDLFRPAKTFGDINAQIRKMLTRSGYGHSLYFSVPGGFAILTPLEHIGPKGEALANGERWCLKKETAKWSFSDYFRKLFVGPDGRYRMFLFIVTPDYLGTAEDVARGYDVVRWIHAGRDVLDPEIAAMPAENKIPIQLFVYEFSLDKGRMEMNDNKMLGLQENTETPLDLSVHLKALRF